MFTPLDQPVSASLSAELHGLAEQLRVHRLNLGEALGVVRERAYPLLMILLALPFCLPVSVPGLSTPLGLVVTLIAGAFALRRPPRLPGFLLRVKLPSTFFRSLLEATSRFVGFLERNLRPRWAWFTASELLLRLHALMILVAALTLAIPAPLPLSNTLPAWGILLGTAGVLQRDGLAILAGYVLTAIAIAYFAVIGLFGWHALDWLRDWWLQP